MNSDFKNPSLDLFNRFVVLGPRQLLQLSVILLLALGVAASMRTALALHASALRYIKLSAGLKTHLVKQTATLAATETAAKATKTPLSAAEPPNSSFKTPSYLLTMQRRREALSNLMQIIAPMLINHQITSLIIDSASSQLSGYCYSFKELNGLVQQLSKLTSTLTLLEVNFLDAKVPFKLSFTFYD